VNPKPKSLILITVDCLRADHCGFHGYPRATTPFLDTLASESLVMPTAIVAGAPTFYSVPAILGSRMPLALGRDVVGLAPGENTLASTLHDAGFATAAFSAANPYISPRFGYDQGFDVFEDFLDFETSTHDSDLADVAARNSSDSTSHRNLLNQSLKRVAHTVGLGSLYDELYFQYCLRVASSKLAGMDELRRFPSADLMIDRAISWLTTGGQKPFFLWLHLMDPHSPYYPSADAYQQVNGREISATNARYLNEFWNRSDLTSTHLKQKKDSVVALYDAGIRAADNQVRRLVSHLKQLEIWDECALVLTADHGEEFLDHGHSYHAPVNLRDEITRVPLMIRCPAAARKSPPATPFSHLHLAPTLLEMLDVPAPANFQGRSLWRNLQQGTGWEDPAITECIYACANPFRAESRLGERLLSVRTARHKLIVRIETGSVEELFDLEADPKEDRPLLPEAQKEVRAQLLQVARTHMRKISDERRATVRLKARLGDLRMQLQSGLR
jgi:arylsulfatase A-like enzyme